MIGTNIRQFQIKTKFTKKAVIKSVKIQFGEQLNKTTGEINVKQFQATLYIPDGDSSSYVPMLGMSLKLGYGNLQLYVQEPDHLERAFIEVEKFITNNKQIMSEILIRERNKWYNRINQESKRKLKPEQLTVNLQVQKKLKELSPRTLKRMPK